MTELTDSDIRIISAVEQYMETHQRQPTYRDVAAMTGWSLSTTWRKVGYLVDRGLLQAEEGSHRSISTVPATYRFWIARLEDGGSIIVSSESGERALELLRFCRKKGEKAPKIHEIHEEIGTLSDILAFLGSPVELIVRTDYDKDES